MIKQPNVMDALIHRFCSTDELRPALATPWYDERYKITVASDSSTIVLARGRCGGESTRERTATPNTPPEWKMISQVLVDWADNSPGPFIGANWQALPVLPELSFGSDDEEKYPIIKPVRIGRAAFSDHLLSRLSELPGLFVDVNNRPLDAMIFRFTGGVGAIMPYRT